jgi:hypothetical protein
MSSGAERVPSAPYAGHEPPVHEATSHCRACGWAGTVAELRAAPRRPGPGDLGIPDMDLVCPRRRCGSLDLGRLRL